MEIFSSFTAIVRHNLRGGVKWQTSIIKLAKMIIDITNLENYSKIGNVGNLQQTLIRGEYNNSFADM